MANPAAPTESGSSKVGFGIYLDGANDAAAWQRIVNASVVADETTKSGAVAVAGLTLADAADPDAEGAIKIGGKSTDHLSAPTEMSAAGDRVNALFDRVGRQAVYQGYVLKSAVINNASSGDNTLVSAVAGKKIRVLAIVLISDGTVDVRFESGAGGTALTGQMPLLVNTGFSIASAWGLFETASNTLLNLELSAAINVHGWITYIEVDD